MLKNKKIRAFTLAETLITLMIIGVVAVLVIPAFVTNVKDQTLNGQRKTANMKLLEGFRQMRVDGKLMEKYDSTEAFVKEMKKYFKINAVCNFPNFGECFTKNFEAISNDGKTTKNYDINTILFDRMIVTQFYDYYDPLAIVFSDGVTMIFSYKKDCVGPAESDTTGNVWQCINYVYDVNGSQAPNIINKDIVSNLDFVEGNSYIVNDTEITPMTTSECEAIGNTILGININDCSAYFAESNSFREANAYRFGAMKACANHGKHLITSSELDELIKREFEQPPGYYNPIPKESSPFKEIWDNNGNNITFLVADNSVFNARNRGQYEWSSTTRDSGATVVCVK